MPPTSRPTGRSRATTPRTSSRSSACGSCRSSGTARASTQTLLGGWQLAGSAILQSGSPINVTTGGTFPRGDYNADNNGGDRPNAPAAGIKTSGWSQDEYLNGIFKVADFPTPAPGENGNLPRNAYRGPGYIDVSLSLTKKFRVQRWSGEFRLDAFNAFNRVNLADPTMDLSSTNFGQGDVAAGAAGVSDWECG